MILFFTGTGNSKYVTDLLAEETELTFRGICGVAMPDNYVRGQKRTEL